MFAGVAGRANLAFDAALTKAARHQDPIHTFEQLQTCAGDILCTDLAQHDLALVRDAGVRQRLVDRLVGILQFGILSDHANAHLALGIPDGINQFFPVLQRTGRFGNAETVENDFVQSGARKHQRDLEQLTRAVAQT